MPTTAADAEKIEKFRTTLETQLAQVEGFGPAQRDDRPDGSTLATRFELIPGLWIEVGLRPSIPQMRAGIVTDDRWLSEDLEQAIEDSGDTMAEFVELGFDEVDLTWTEPTVEHYREQGKYFYFSTGDELANLTALDDPATLDKLVKMARGYYAAFRPVIEKQRSEQAD